MKKMLKNKKGMSLVTVMVIMTALIVLCAILLESVTQTLIMTKRHQNIDFAYYAGESAIENWTNRIEDVLNTVFGDDFGPVNTSDDANMRAYGNHIISKIGNSIFTNQYIDVAANSNTLTGLTADNSAEVLWEGPLELIDVKLDTVSTDSVIIRMGIKAKSNFSYSEAYNTSNKLVYAVKAFKVKLPKSGNQLEGAVYSIGDFFVRNNSANPVKVKGDVFVFGSHPEKTVSKDQHYYGGIYAKEEGYLKIYGNAYSRSFIRTGPYDESVVGYIDLSRIYIFKDAIAQSIQAFANEDKIAVLRNAYTFDDIEINGSKSVIGVNGSYFGLSKGGDTSNHDESSAIVNSAIIHRQLHPESFLSRVTINGDVILGGSTFKVSDDGTRLGTIEDASLAYNTREELPHYKSFSVWEDNPLAYDPLGYHRDLRTMFKSNYIECDFNQFQVFNIFDPFDGVYNENDIDEWLKKNKPADYEKTASDNLRGFSFYEMVGNKNKMYTNSLGIDPVLAIPDETKYSSNLFVKSSGYTLDNIFKDDNTPRFGKDYWDNVTNVNYEDNLFGYLHPDLTGKTVEEVDVLQNGYVGIIKRELMKKVERFASREYLGNTWKQESGNEFDELFEKIDLKGPSTYIVPIVQGDLDFPTDPNGTIYDLSQIFLKRRSIDIYDVCNNSRDRYNVSGDFKDDDDYFIVTNKDPKVHIKVSGTFNGIILTAGKLILDNGANIYGSVIVAGDGYYVDKDGDGDDDFIPQAKVIKTTDDVNKMDNGEFAAVIADSNTVAPYIDFFLGLAGKYDDPFNKVSMENVIVEAENSPRGYTLMPLGITGDERLSYLNKAARINLLEKFSENGIDLYDIF